MKKFVLLHVFLVGLAFSAEAMENRPSQAQSIAQKRKSPEPEISSEVPAIDLEPVYPQLYYSPGKAIENVIIKLMQERRRETIIAAYYMVTSDTITDWWAARKFTLAYDKAKEANDIKGMLNAERFKTEPNDDILIVDKDTLALQSAKESGKALTKLHRAGITVLVRTKPFDSKNPQKRDIMHHKFLIFCGKNPLVITGSANLTNQSEYNAENIIILDDIKLINELIAMHVELRQYCDLYNPGEKNSP